jgi:serine/threonine protein kinase, bacterial
MSLAEGDVFAGYTVVRKLGAGGMGEVYLVQHPRLPRYDALKILPMELTTDREYAERFNREANLVARLWHPHIVGVHDRGEHDGQLWITMDFVEGTDAARLLSERGGGGLPPEDVVRIVTAVADALDYAHQQELLHRDVKPSNILLAQSNSKFSRALLADFGIARMVKDTAGLTATDMTVGTVAYAAPEQLMGHALDGRADQYALAASAFHLLTGQQLFQHDNPAVVISNHLTASPPAIGERIPELSGLGPAFERALAKSPADRFDTCTDFAEAMAHGLSAAAQGLGATDATVAALPSGRQSRQSPKGGPGSRRLRLALLVAGILAVLVGVAIAAGLFIANKEEPSAQRAPAAPTANTPAVPVVRIGADCDPLGAAGVATTGAQAYCSRSAANTQLWSVY